MPRTLRDLKKNEFIALELGGMTMWSYETNFLALYRYVTQLGTIDKERIRLVIRKINYEKCHNVTKNFMDSNARYATVLVTTKLMPFLDKQLCC